MRPDFGAMNDQGQWFNGKDWCNLAKTERGAVEEDLSKLEKLRQHWLDGCHANGCFTCPRCRKMHFIPDNFDYLCDGCVDTLLVHPNSSKTIIDGIHDWKDKAKIGKASPEVAARYLERDELMLAEGE